MANVNKIFGLRPIKHLDGSPYNGNVMRCYVPAADGTALFVGDAVKSYTESATDGTHQVIQAAAGDAIFGVVVGFEPDNSNLALLHRAVSTLRTVLVCTATDVIYRISTNSTGIAKEDIGLNGDIEVGSGNTTTGLSGMELDADASPALGTSTAQLRILGLSQIPDNALGAYAVVDVLINEHELKSTTGV